MADDGDRRFLAISYLSTSPGTLSSMSFRPGRVDGADLFAAVRLLLSERNIRRCMRISDTVEEIFLGIHQSRSRPANAVGSLTATHEKHA